MTFDYISLTDTLIDMYSSYCLEDANTHSQDWKYNNIGIQGPKYNKELNIVN